MILYNQNIKGNNFPSSATQTADQTSTSLIQTDGFDLKENNKTAKSSKFLETLAILSKEGAIIMADKAAHDQTQATLNTILYMRETQENAKKETTLTNQDIFKTIPGQEENKNREKYYKIQEEENFHNQARLRYLKARQEILTAQKKHNLFLSKEQTDKLLQSVTLDATANPFSKDMTGLEKALTKQEKQIRKELSQDNKTADQNAATIDEFSKKIRLKNGITLRISKGSNQDKRKMALLNKAKWKDAPALESPVEILKKKINKKESEEGVLATEILKRRIIGLE